MRQSHFADDDLTTQRGLLDEEIATQDAFSLKGPNNYHPILKKKTHNLMQVEKSEASPRLDTEHGLLQTEASEKKTA